MNVTYGTNGTYATKSKPEPKSCPIGPIRPISPMKNRPLRKITQSTENCHFVAIFQEKLADRLWRSFSRARDRVGPIEFSGIPVISLISR